MKPCYLNVLHIFHNILSTCSLQFVVCFLTVTATWVYIGNIPTDGNFLWCSIFLTYWSQNLLCKNVFCHAICLRNFEALPSTWHISMKSERSDSPEECSSAQVCPLWTLPCANSVPCLSVLISPLPPLMMLFLFNVQIRAHSSQGISGTFFQINDRNIHILFWNQR